MSSAWSVATLALAAAVLTAGCEQQQADQSADAAPSDTQTPQQANAADTAASSSLWRGGEQVPLDLQVAHPNGVVLQLTSLQSRDTETVVGVRVINGNRNAIDLNRYNSRDGYIVVESGERLYLSPPAGNTRLAIQPGQTLEGELVFLGRLPQSQSAVLVINENSSTDSQHTRVPGFRIDLPLAGAATSETAG